MKTNNETKKERPDRALLFRILIWVLEIFLVLLLAYGVSRLFFGTFTMQESSMEPTISAGNTLLLNKAAYRFGSPKRGDVIAYRTSDETVESLHIKRVIGLPGETIRIRDGQVLINGETYQEKTDFPSIIDAGLAEQEIHLADDEFFVLGDNRNGSEDSRYASVGNVRRRFIAGKVWLRVWPLTRFGGV